MYREAFKKIQPEDLALIIDKVNNDLGGTPFDPNETTALAWDIPFYKGYRLIELVDHTSTPEIKRFIIYSADKHVIIDWKNQTIYDFNAKAPLKLDDESVIDYVSFFFTYVKGKHGRFIIVENVDDIHWKEEPPPNARKAISDMIDPITLIKSSGGQYNLKACMTFKNALFSCAITIQPDGHLVMDNEKLLIEDLPILDDIFNQ